MYFDPFPKVKYNSVDAPDITAANLIESYGRDSFFEYEIEEGETPEMIAHRLYGDSEYASFILRTNNIVDPYEQWPLDELALQTLAQQKYDNIYATHHYLNSAGNIVSDKWPETDRVAVSNIDHEHTLNEEKRKIMLLHPDLMPAYAKQHRDLMGG